MKGARSPANEYGEAKLCPAATQPLTSLPTPMARVFALDVVCTG
jgi:hypothetical protein